MKTYAIIVAAGFSNRFGGEVPKQFKEICGRPLLSWTIEKFERAAAIDNIMVVVAEEYLLYTSSNIIDPYGFHKVVKIVKGGESRQESVLNGLRSLPISTRYVAIHDGARLLVESSDIDRVVAAAVDERAAILAEPSTDTIKRTAGGYIIGTLDRRVLYKAQTPQVFQYDLILAAHEEFANDKNHEMTDDASLIEERGFKVRIVEPSSYNLKVTEQSDFKLAEFLLREQIHE